MAWHLAGTKPLPKPMLIYDQLDHSESISENQHPFQSIFFEEQVLKNVVCYQPPSLLEPHCVMAMHESGSKRELLYTSNGHA